MADQTLSEILRIHRAKLDRELKELRESNNEVAVYLEKQREKGVGQ